MEHSNIQLPPHQQRVVDEQIELLDKLTKLRSFLTIDFFKTLEEDDQKDLKDQEIIMTDYNNILLKRISKF